MSPQEFIDYLYRRCEQSKVTHCPSLAECDRNSVYEAIAASIVVWKEEYKDKAHG